MGDSKRKRGAEMDERDGTEGPERLRRARERAAEYAAGEAGEAPPEPSERSDPRHIVEQRIREAMAAGVFDDLPGQGQPLDLRRDGYVDPTTDVVHRLLRDAGEVPEWIAREKAIVAGETSARQQLAKAWSRCGGDDTSIIWRRALEVFAADVERLNRQIADYNIVTPIRSRRRGLLRFRDEVQKVTGRGLPPRDDTAAP